MGKFRIINQVNESLLKEMIKLDELVYNKEDVGDLEKCKSWININPNIYTVLLYDDEIIGYINFMPITNKAYKRIKQGKLKDYELTTEDIVEYSEGKTLKYLLTSIVIKPEYQDTQAIIELWTGFLNKIKEFNLIVSNLIVDCVSEHGEKFIKQNLKVKYITNSNNGKIYEGILNKAQTKPKSISI